MFSSVKRLHFIGIGGIGMSGIAEILLSQGFKVSGSDLSQSEVTDHLASLGAIIQIGHDEKNVEGADVVVYSSAVKQTDNPEMRAAITKKIPTIRRAEMLAEVARLTYCLGVAGTHGKTTTTSMNALVMMKAGIDPTVIVGGKLRGLGGSNARLGAGDWTVVEADEFDRSFLQLQPTIAVITNVEEDHLDIYTGLDDIKNAFVEFANKVPFYGLVVACIDDKGVRDIMPRIKKRILTYGLSPHADVRARHISFKNLSSNSTIYIHDKPIGELTLNIPGRHNIKNALAAVAVAYSLGIPFETIAAALGEFTGVFRRFEVKGTYNGVMIVDDYAHHPSELKATLQAAQSGWEGRVVGVFQPHTFTRTRDFVEEFGRSFEDADVLVITDVYAAREKPIEGITGEIIAEAARQSGHKEVHYVQDKNALPDFLKTIVHEGDMLITLGAGDIWKCAKAFGETGELVAGA